MRWHDTTCTYFRGVSCLLGEEQWLHKAFDTQQLKIVTKRPSWFLVCNVMVEEQYQVPVQCRVYEFCEILLFSLGPSLGLGLGLGTWITVLLRCSIMPLSVTACR